MKVLLALLVASRLITCACNECPRDVNYTQSTSNSSTPIVAKEKLDIIEPIPFSQVNINDVFWKKKIETNRSVTIPYAFNKCEQSGHISRFTTDPDTIKTKYQWRYSRDSDVYKVMEGAAYSLQAAYDPILLNYLEKLIDKIASAQWDDGYLYTFYSVPEKHPEKRWTDIQRMHELYCAGHMYEAAVAHYQATVSKKFLNIAVKNADLVCSVFNPNKRADPPGHQEIEIALCKLHRATDNKKYLQQAKFFLDQRGRTGNRQPDGKGGLYGTYAQDHKPVTDQTKPVGHSVRALYMYTAMADVASLTGDTDYIKAIDAIWNNVVNKKLYITGGIGAKGAHEGFGEDYELPNKTAYCETCASIANAMWNHRMFLLHADAGYIDVLERVLYNGVLSGVSLYGDRFFYSNPLESDGKNQRSEWFRVACCPSNIARFLPSVPGYIYAHKNNAIYINLFIQSNATLNVKTNAVKIIQQTNYPWDGNIQITVKPAQPDKFPIYLRIPGWTRNRPTPGNLYNYLNESTEQVTLKVNDSPVEINVEKGFAKIERFWNSGDKIELNLPMPIRKVIAHPNVTADAGLVVIERGPVVYCAEGIDNGGSVYDIIIDDSLEFSATYEPGTLRGVVVLRSTEPDITLVPYYTWANRGSTPMKVWLPRDQ